MKSYEVSYDFEHLVDDVELSVEEMNDRNETIWNMFLLNGGIEGRLSKHVGLQFKGVIVGMEIKPDFLSRMS